VQEELAYTAINGFLTARQDCVLLSSLIGAHAPLSYEAILLREFSEMVPCVQMYVVLRFQMSFLSEPSFQPFSFDFPDFELCFLVHFSSPVKLGAGDYLAFFYRNILQYPSKGPFS